MAQFQNSPGVYSTEVDATGIVAAVATSTGALGGVFRWGPVEQAVLVSNEDQLVSTFGTPTNHNPETFFTAANFLTYSDSLYIVRAANTSGTNTNIANTTLSAIAYVNAIPSNNILITSTVKNSDDFLTKSFDSSVYYVGKFPGALGNSLRVSQCDSVNAYQSSTALVANSDVNAAATFITYAVGSNTATVFVSPSGTGTGATTTAVTNAVANNVQVGDLVKAGNSTIGYQYLKVSNVGASVANGSNSSLVLSFTTPFTLSSDVTANTVDRVWEFFGAVSKAPGQSVWNNSVGNTAAQDEMHVVVVDKNGLFTGTPGAVLEVFESVSRATDAQNESGKSIFYKNIINNGSRYIWAAADRPGATSTTAALVASSTNVKPLYTNFVGGQDGNTETNTPLSDLARAYDKFADPDQIDVSIIMQGQAKGGVNGTGLANYIIANIAENRKDAVITISPEYADVVNALGQEADNVVAFRNSLTNTSYGILDSGYKYQYDKYNDVYRYVPMNGDVAGVIARTDNTNDPWWSPAGYNRGRILNVVKLAFNPTQAQRDILYKADVNSIFSSPGQSPILFGDKTLLGKPSAFDRINVRRLFIVLRKAISQASRQLLFEFNDAFTRAQFINMVDPYMRDVEARRGCVDYKIVCDETNNTEQVINNNGFVGQVFVQPNKSINTIQLQFIATRTGVSFSETVGTSSF